MALHHSTTHGSNLQEATINS